MSDEDGAVMDETEFLNNIEEGELDLPDEDDDVSEDVSSQEDLDDYYQEIGLEPDLKSKGKKEQLYKTESKK